MIGMFSNVTDMYRMFTFSGLDTTITIKTLKDGGKLDNVNTQNVNLGSLQT